MLYKIKPFSWDRKSEIIGSLKELFISQWKINGRKWYNNSFKNSWYEEKLLKNQKQWSITIISEVN